MKTREIIKLIEADGWALGRVTGSHYLQASGEKGIGHYSGSRHGQRCTEGNSTKYPEASGVAIMSNHEYAAIFEQAEDGTWAGYVPDLPVVLATGDTLEAAQENMREGIRLWMEEAKKDGLPIPSPSTRACNIDVAA